MILFRELTLDDKKIIDGALKRIHSRSAEYCFGSYYMWRHFNKIKIAFFNDDYVISFGSYDEIEGESFLFPADASDLPSLLGEIKEYSASKNQPVVFNVVSKADVDKIASIHKGEIEVWEERNHFDYIYDLIEMSELSGKKYHGKRNHIARFAQNENWQYEEITQSNLGECIEMNREWCCQNDCGRSVIQKEECCAVKEALKSFFDLGFFGGLLRLDGRVIAYTAGERLNDDVVCIHIEKAFSEIQGAYPMIAKQFSQQLVNMGFKYSNREEDLGVEGLRKAKLSYYPIELHEKYGVILK